MTPDFDIYLHTCQQRVQQALAECLNETPSEFSQTDTTTWLQSLNAAMRYSLTNGGKRIRPMLVYAAAEAVSTATDAAILDPVACAVECIHAYSLVHDDLPAMDDDDLRRGQPTCHRQFDEATAILAGDALQTRAFELLSQIEELPAQRRLELIARLASAAGSRGMVGGQAIDLGAVQRHIELPQLEAMHRLKTGALIRAAVALGALAAGATPHQLSALDRYADALGLCFQVQDDILDVTGDTATLGKQAQADLARDKPTYPALMGLSAAQEYALTLQSEALSALESFGERALRLHQLADFVLSRSH